MLRGREVQEQRSEIANFLLTKCANERAEARAWMYDAGRATRILDDPHLLVTQEHVAGIINPILGQEKSN